MGNILWGQQAELQALPRTANRNTEMDPFQQRLLGPEAAREEATANCSRFRHGTVCGEGGSRSRAGLLWPRCRSTPGWSSASLLDPRGWQVGRALASDVASWLGKHGCNASGTLPAASEMAICFSYLCWHGREGGSSGCRWAVHCGRHLYLLAGWRPVAIFGGRRRVFLGLCWTSLFLQ